MKKTLSGFLVFIIICVILRAGYITARDYFYPNKYSNYISEYSKEFNVDPLLVKAIIKAESSYNKDAKSSVGAKGLMQITDSTGAIIARQLGIKNFTPEMLYDPQINIEFGTFYISELLNQFGNKDNAIAAYNAGCGNVSSWLGNSEYSTDGKVLNKIPFLETASYVKNVNKYEHMYGKLYKNNNV